MGNLNGRVICLKKSLLLGLRYPAWVLPLSISRSSSNVLIICLLQEDKTFTNSNNKGKEKIRNGCVAGKKKKMSVCSMNMEVVGVGWMVRDKSTEGLPGKHIDKTKHWAH